MTIGAGIAVGCIWLAVAVVGNKDGGAAIFTAIFAMLATLAITCHP